MTTLAVLLAGRHVAEVEQTADGAVCLRWRDDYRAEAAATPLSLSMASAESATVDGDRAMAWLEGLLPGDSMVQQFWASDHQLEEVTVVALLGSPLGRDCAGAVQFGRLDMEPAGEERPLTNTDIAQRLGFIGAQSRSMRCWQIAPRFTLAGNHPKTALVARDGAWSDPVGDTATTHILKPPQPRFAHQDVNEHLCLSAARRAGLHAARSTLGRFADRTAVVVERFDRATQPDGATSRLHQEDLCQALGHPPWRRYQQDGGPSPVQIAALLRRHGGADGEGDVWRFADALAFNWLIALPDAHAKNYAVLLDGPQVRLAPVYDIASSLPYDPEQELSWGFDPRVSLAMDIGGEYRLDAITATDWRRTAHQLGVDADTLTERIVALAGRLPDAFAHAADDPAVRDTAADFADQLCDLVARRAMRLAAGLETAGPDGRRGR